MMFLVRTRGEAPQAAGVAIKRVRRTPAILPDAEGHRDFFCVGDAGAPERLRAQGRTIVALHDGWYADDTGGGVAIFGQGKYWEVRDTPFTVEEAVGPAGEATAAGAGDGEIVNVRGAIFGGER
jgi:hypothetical protein